MINAAQLKERISARQLFLLAFLGLTLLVLGGCSHVIVDDADDMDDDHMEEVMGDMMDADDMDMMDDTDKMGDMMDGDTMMDGSEMMKDGEGKEMMDEMAKMEMKTFVVSGENFVFTMNGEEAPELRVKKGQKVRIEFTAESGFHDWKIDEFSAATEKVRDGASTFVEFVADKTGTFEYYCSVGQHRANGMKGNLIVE